MAIASVSRSWSFGQNCGQEVRYFRVACVIYESRSIYREKEKKKKEEKNCNLRTKHSRLFARSSRSFANATAVENPVSFECGYLLGPVV